MRAMRESGDAFRVRETTVYKEGGEPHVFYHGPYADASTAKAQRTRLQRRYRRYGSARWVATFAIERTATDWQEVPE